MCFKGWYCFRWNKRRCLVLVLALTILTCFLVIDSVHQTQHEISVDCSDRQSKDFILDICKNYTAGYLTGSICQPLCNSNSISYKKCLGHKETDLVLLAWWKEQGNVILKADVNLKSTKLFHFQESMSEDQLALPYHMSLVSQFKEHLKAGYNISDHVIDRILLECDFEQDGILTNREALYCWHMLDKDEVLLSLKLENMQLVPGLYGTCGNLIAFEYIPGQSLRYPIVTDKRSWNFRVQLSISLIELVERFDDISKADNYLLCDSQEGNYGVVQSPDGGGYVAMSVDNDLTISEGSLQRSLNFEKNNSCSSNYDCSFIDCDVHCDTSTRKCSGIILSNNLQLICKRFFVPKVQTLLSKTLLHDPPESISRELQSLISQCIAPANNSTKISRKLSKEFKALLLKSINDH